MMDCPECGAKPGAWHQVGCSWAQCPYCGDHLTACDHEPPRDDQLRWAGCDFWLAACLQLRLFRRKTAAGWVRCGADDPDSLPDLWRLFREFTWSRAEKEFIPCDGRRSGGRTRPPRSAH